jgi:hypothetical protein
MRRVMCSNLSALPPCVNTIPSEKRKVFREKSGEAAFPQAGKREVGAKIYQKSRATAAGRTVSRPFRHCFATVSRPFRDRFGTFPPAARVTLLSRCGICHARVTLRQHRPRLRLLSRVCHAAVTLAELSRQSAAVLVLRHGTNRLGGGGCRCVTLVSR